MSRKALIIGINYNGTSSALSGCIYDAENILNLVRRMYGNTVDIRFLKETDKDLSNRPTRDNILKRFGWLVSNNKPGDSLFVHYSGHGGSIPDDDPKEERDRRDETIYPLDGHIRDDDIRKELVDKVIPGVKLTCFFDCCHSGTVLDLKYGYIQPQTGILKSFVNNVPETSADVVLFSGCKDDQYSWEVYDERRIQGAMTNSLVKAMNDLSGIRKPNPERVKIVRTLNTLKKRRSDNQKAMIRNAKNIRLVRINKRIIARMNRDIQKYTARYNRTKPFVKSEPKQITYSNLMATLLGHLKNNGNKQDPQISSGKLLDLNSVFSIF